MLSGFSSTWPWCCSPQAPTPGPGGYGFLLARCHMDVYRHLTWHAQNWFFPLKHAPSVLPSTWLLYSPHSIDDQTLPLLFLVGVWSIPLLSGLTAGLLGHLPPVALWPPVLWSDLLPQELLWGLSLPCMASTAPVIRCGLFSQLYSSDFLLPLQTHRSTQA